jgi:hypothetical protein
LLAGLAPAVYEALDLDVSLDVIGKHAHLFKILQDRFRLAWTVTALGSADDFQKDISQSSRRVGLLPVSKTLC